MAEHGGGVVHEPLRKDQGKPLSIQSGTPAFVVRALYRGQHALLHLQAQREPVPTCDERALGVLVVSDDSARIEEAP